MTPTKIFARVRKVAEWFDPEAQGADPVGLALSQQLELLIAQSATPYQEITRAGRGYWVNTTGAAAVVALPTTAVMLWVYNNYPDGGPCAVIDWVAASGVAKTAAAGQAQLICNLGQTREAAGAVNAAVVVKRTNSIGISASGGSGSQIYGGTAALPAGSGVVDRWFPLGPAVGFPGAAATPGHGLYARTDGMFIVAPGRYFAMHVIADVVGSTFAPFIGYHERQFNLGM